FGKGTPAENRLSRVIRERVIEEAATVGLDLIFTYVWNFSLDKGKQNIDRYKEIYEQKGGKVYFVELTASLAIRTQRAASLERHRQKPNTAGAEEVVEMEHTQRFESPKPFFYSEQYRYLDASDKTPQQIASEIISWLG